MKLSTESKAQTILRMFEEKGNGLTAVEFAQLVLQSEEVFTREELSMATAKWAAIQIKRVLKRNEPETGLPFALPTHENLWKQLILFNEEEFEELIQRNNRGIQADIAQNQKLIDAFIARFGREPNID